LKLLFDENLSQRLVASVGDLYPDSRHVEECGLIGASDDDVWNFAAANGFAIVSKDSDFSERSTLRGSPPKVIWLRIGNCTTDSAISVLRDKHPNIRAFIEAKMESCLVVSVAPRLPVRRVQE
jgi:predicted nuclease of predicted toxin-antitoxin system